MQRLSNVHDEFVFPSPWASVCPLSFSPRLPKAMAAPRFMRAVTLTGFGGVDVLRVSANVPMPVPKPGEALVRIAYAGVNGPDLLQVVFRQLRYPFPLASPPTHTPASAACAVRHTCRTCCCRVAVSMARAAPGRVWGHPRS
jgi:hypothetical protein